MPNRGPTCLREIVEVQNQGRRIILTLSCGHTKLHSSRVHLPGRAHCADCKDSVT